MDSAKKVKNTLLKLLLRQRKIALGPRTTKRNQALWLATLTTSYTKRESKRRGGIYLTKKALPH